MSVRTVLTLVALLATQTPPHWLQRQPNLPSAQGPAYAFFELAPANGAGMGAECACSTITGAKGETTTVARTTGAFCSKGGLRTTGIVDGDLVWCPINTSRVMRDADGVLGPRVEPGGINYSIRSEEFDQWTVENGSSSNTVVTANTAVSPDGAMTMDTIAFPATSSGQFSGIRQTACPVGVCTNSVYVKATSTACSFDICTSGASGYECTLCSAPADGTSTRCWLTTTASPGGGITYLGNMTSVNGGFARAACSVRLWGSQIEGKARPSTYIPTSNVAGSRDPDVPASTLSTGSWPTGSIAFNFQPVSSTDTVGQAGFSSNARALYGNGSSVLSYDGTNNPGVTANGTAAASKRYCARWSAGSGWVVKNVTDATQATSAFTSGTWAPDSTLELAGVAGIYPDGIASRVALDPTTGVCP